MYFRKFILETNNETDPHGAPDLRIVALITIFVVE